MRDTHNVLRSLRFRGCNPLHYLLSKCELQPEGSSGRRHFQPPCCNHYSIRGETMSNLLSTSPRPLMNLNNLNYNGRIGYETAYPRTEYRAKQGTPTSARPRLPCVPARVCLCLAQSSRWALRLPGGPHRIRQGAPTSNGVQMACQVQARWHQGIGTRGAWTPRFFPLKREKPSEK